MSANAQSISIVVAMDENRLIGQAGDLPWRLPNDLKHFKRVTMGKTLLMGRKTWESLPGALPGRPNWVVSRQPDFKSEGARVFGTVDAALDAHAAGELMVIGGADLFRQVLPQATRIYLTQVRAAIPAAGDREVYFPGFDESAFVEIWREEHAADDRHRFAYTFLTLERR